jgi:hypothetical protein
MRAGKWKFSTAKDPPGAESMGHRFNQYPRKVYQLTTVSRISLTWGHENQSACPRVSWRIRLLRWPAGIIVRSLR